MSHTRAQCNECHKVVSPKEKYFEIPSPSPRIPWIVRCNKCQVPLAGDGLAAPRHSLGVRRATITAPCAAAPSPCWCVLYVWIPGVSSRGRVAGTQEARRKAVPHRLLAVHVVLWHHGQNAHHRGRAAVSDARSSVASVCVCVCAQCPCFAGFAPNVQTRDSRAFARAATSPAAATSLRPWTSNGTRTGVFGARRRDATRSPIASLTCFQCKAAFPDGNFYVVKDQPACKRCAEAAQ